MPRKLGALLAVLALASPLAGCSSKKLALDPSFTQPEGTFSSQLELITYFDDASTKIRVKDRGQIGKVDVGSDTTIIDSIQVDPVTRQLLLTPVRNYTPGTVRGLVLNRTSAEGIEIYRSDANGGVRRIFDFALQPERRYLDRNTEVYEFVDSDPSRPIGSTYFARGLLGGMGGATSPLSNGSRPVATPLTIIQYQAERWGTLVGLHFNDADSNFVMKWSPVPGASKYLIQIFEYQSKILSLTQRILTGTPAPLMTLAAHDDFIASVPASITQYKINDPGATIYTSKTLHLRTEYYVRISALDATSQMIGMTTGPTITQTRDLSQMFLWPLDRVPKDFFVDFSDPEVASATPPAYLLYSRGAAWVAPGLNPNPTSAMERAR